MPPALPGVRELTDHLAGLAVGRLVDPLEILLEDDATADVLRGRLTGRAAVWAGALLGDDDAAAVRTAARIIGALYPGDTGFAPPADWWRTPLGRVVARRVGPLSAAPVSYPVAGAMLGITRQGVHDLVRRGRLDLHPDGGVDPASLRARLTGVPHRPPSTP